MFYKKGVLKTFAKFRRDHLVGDFFNELANSRYLKVLIITDALQNCKKKSIKELYEKMEMNKLTLSCFLIYFVFLVRSFSFFFFFFFCYLFIFFEIRKRRFGDGCLSRDFSFLNYVN